MIQSRMPTRVVRMSNSGCPASGVGQITLLANFRTFGSTGLTVTLKRRFIVDDFSSTDFSWLEIGTGTAAVNGIA